MKVIETARKVEIDGVEFSDEMLHGLIALGNRGATVRLYMIAGKLFFSDVLESPPEKAPPTETPTPT